MAGVSGQRVNSDRGVTGDWEDRVGSSCRAQ